MILDDALIMTQTIRLGTLHELRHRRVGFPGCIRWYQFNNQTDTDFTLNLFIGNSSNAIGAEFRLNIGDFHDQLGVTLLSAHCKVGLDILVPHPLQPRERSRQNHRIQESQDDGSVMVSNTQ